MFVAPKILIIDDKQEHMTGLEVAFDELNAGTRLLHYTAEDVGDWTPIPGVRLIFIDKNLTELATTSGKDNKIAFNAILDALEKVVCPAGGPYGLILWAESPDLEEFVSYYEKRGGSSFIRPAFCAAMTKTQFIDTQSGKVKDVTKLREAILSHVAQNPQMSALLHWEADVVHAMSGVLESLFHILPNVESGDNFNNNLGELLFRLAEASAGKDGATKKPKQAVENVLHHMLSDRLSAKSTEPDIDNIWKEAMIQPKQRSFPTASIGAINSALHLEYFDDNDNDPTKIGSLIEYPFGDPSTSLPIYFGFNLNDLLGDKMMILPEEDFVHCRLVLIRVGASCDDAQPKMGPLNYILGVEWPFTHSDGSKKEGAKRHSKKSYGTSARLETPILLVGKKGVPGRFTFFYNATISVPKHMTANWKSMGRLRNDISDTLTVEYTRHISRPGLISL